MADRAGGAAGLAEPDNPPCTSSAPNVYQRRRGTETPLMAKAIFGAPFPHGPPWR